MTEYFVNITHNGAQKLVICANSAATDEKKTYSHTDRTSLSAIIFTHRAEAYRPEEHRQESAVRREFRAEVQAS